MANILNKTKVGKIDRSQGQRIASVAKQDPLSKDIVSPQTPSDIPNNCALTCPNCASCSFYVILQGKCFCCGCSKCGWEGKLNIPSRIDDGSSFNSTLRCQDDKCDNDTFSFIRVQDKLGIGCTKCFQGIEVNVDEKLIIVPK